MKYVIRWDEAGAQSPVGAKGRALAILAKVGMPVPPWVALTPDAFAVQATGVVSPGFTHTLSPSPEAHSIPCTRLA